MKFELKYELKKLLSPPCGRPLEMHSLSFQTIGMVCCNQQVQEAG